MKVDEFNNKVRNFVNAEMQSKIYKEIFAELDKELQDISKRGRNTKIKSFAKSCSPTEYRNATAFEVLIGTLHLLGNEKKIKENILHAHSLGLRDNNGEGNPRDILSEEEVLAVYNDLLDGARIS